MPKLANLSHLAYQIYDKIFYVTLAWQIFDMARPCMHERTDYWTRRPAAARLQVH